MRSTLGQQLEPGALGHHVDLGGRLWRRWRLAPFGRFVDRERHAEDVHVFGPEQSVLVFVVSDAAQAAADHLLAQELGREGTQTHDVGDVLGVPAFRQHGDGDDVLQVLARTAALADIVDDLAEQLFLLQLLQTLFSRHRDVGRIHDRLQTLLVSLVGCSLFADLRLLQNLRIHPQRPLGSAQFRPVSIAGIEVALDAGGGFCPVANRQHHRR